MSEITNILVALLFVVVLGYVLVVAPNKAYKDYINYRDDYCVKYFGSNNFVGSELDSKYDVINCGYLVDDSVVKRSLPYLDYDDMKEELNKG